MLIIMLGLPGAGKSVAAKAMAKALKVECINPAEWYPANLDSLSEDVMRDFKVAAWEHALDKCTSAIAAKRSVIIDTCGTNTKSTNELAGLAKLHGHKVIIIFVASPPSECGKRRDPNIVAGYIDKVRVALGAYKQQMRICAIKNHGTEVELNDAAARLAENL